MRQSISERAVSALLAFLLVLSLFSGLTPPVFAVDILLGTPTGYQQASDVVYVWEGTNLKNWGARGEVCRFLTTYAQEYYVGDYSFEALSEQPGSSVPEAYLTSDLYLALRAMVQAKQTFTTTYSGTRNLYRYTDCVNSDSAYISSFYSGIRLNGAWDSGNTWNREHTWPNSKGNDNQDNDIMMLRPTSVQENSTRGNKAYGESSGYYHPNSEAGSSGVDLRGDCARIMLYCYVRWSNQDYMWGIDGVIESAGVLLAWMEADPVDTWEMGRNDAVQSITGVRNCFVDYPELAFLLFGQAVPEGYPSPSGSAVPDHEHDYQEVDRTPATCTEDGSILYRCTICMCEKQETIPALGHEAGEAVRENEAAASCTEPGGFDTAVYCTRCQTELTRVHTPIPALGHDWDSGTVTTEPTVTEAGEMTYACLRCGATRTEPIGALTFRFDDVRNEKKFYFQPVYWAFFHDPQVTKGTDETHFSPNRICTRGQVVTFLWRAMGCPEPTQTTHNFTDVKSTAYYYQAMLWAVEAGVTTGTSGTTFSPNRNATRGQVVTFLWRALGKPKPTQTESPFTDVKADGYYYKAMLWALETGVTTGTSDTTFGPEDPASRGHVVTFLYRAVCGES